jgi:hypothetical protein
VNGFGSPSSRGSEPCLLDGMGPERKSVGRGASPASLRATGMASQMVRVHVDARLGDAGAQAGVAASEVEDD